MTFFPYTRILCLMFVVHPVNSFLPLYTELSRGTMTRGIMRTSRFRGSSNCLNGRSRLIMTDMKQGTAAVDFMDNLGSVLEQLWSSKPGSEDWSPYSQDLVFQDPLQRTTGLAAYKASLSLLKNSSLFGLPIMQVATLQVHAQISEALTHRTTHRSTTRPSLVWIVSGACDISPYGAGTTT